MSARLLFLFVAFLSLVTNVSGSFFFTKKADGSASRAGTRNGTAQAPTAGEDDNSFWQGFFGHLQSDAQSDEMKRCAAQLKDLMVNRSADVFKYVLKQQGSPSFGKLAVIIGVGMVLLIAIAACVTGKIMRGILKIALSWAILIVAIAYVPQLKNLAITWLSGLK